MKSALLITLAALAAPLAQASSDETIPTLPEVLSTSTPDGEPRPAQDAQAPADSTDAAPDDAAKRADDTGRAGTFARDGGGEQALLTRAEVDRLPVRALWNIPYAGLREARHRLDLYLPREPAVFPLPVIVYFHGGDWISGDKRVAARRLLPFVLSGRYAVVSANYRLAADAQWPAQIEDAKAVIRWVRAGARRYGVDAERIGVWGEDAGAQLAMLLGTTGDISTVEGDFGRLGANSRVQAVAAFSGYADLPTLIGGPGRVDHDAPWSSTARMLGGPPSQRPEAARQASPLHWVTSDDAPTLLVHGVLDRVVPIEQSRAMHAALGAAGVPSALVPVANAAHDGFGAAADAHVRAFFERHLHGKPVALPSDSIDDWRP